MGRADEHNKEGNYNNERLRSSMINLGQSTQPAKHHELIKSLGRLWLRTTKFYGIILTTGGLF